MPATEKKLFTIVGKIMLSIFHYDVKSLGSLVQMLYEFKSLVSQALHKKIFFTFWRKKWYEFIDNSTKYDYTTKPLCIINKQKRGGRGGRCRRPSAVTSAGKKPTQYKGRGMCGACAPALAISLSLIANRAVSLNSA